MAPSTGRPSLFDVDPFGDVDFECLAREQAAAARRVNRVSPSEVFMGVVDEKEAIGRRLERVLQAALANNALKDKRTVPVIIIYAAEPSLERPELYWRSSPGRSKLVLDLAVIDGKTRLDSKLPVHKEASIELTRVDLFGENNPAHAQIKNVDEEWVLEPGTFLPAERVDVVLIQENAATVPQRLHLEPLSFAKASIMDRENQE